MINAERRFNKKGQEYFITEDSELPEVVVTKYQTPRQNIPTTSKVYVRDTKYPDTYSYDVWQPGLNQGLDLITPEFDILAGARWLGLPKYIGAEIVSHIGGRVGNKIDKGIGGNGTIGEVVGNLAGFGAGIHSVNVIKNMSPQRIREHVFASRAPLGYDNVGKTLMQVGKRILSGARSDIETPTWFNDEFRKTLESFAHSIPPSERNTIVGQRFKDWFGDHASKARFDAWRMYNKLPQKYNTFTPNPKHPGTFTDVEGLDHVRWVPIPRNNITYDFINTSGGMVNAKTRILGDWQFGGGKPKRFGVLSTSDVFDLHPFSRPENKLRQRLNMRIRNLTSSIWESADKLKNSDSALKQSVGKYFDDIGERIWSIGNKIRDAKFLKPLEDKLSRLEVGDVTGAQPFTVTYDVPFTQTMTMTNSDSFIDSSIKGFHSKDLLPKEVLLYNKGIIIDPLEKLNQLPIQEIIKDLTVKKNE